MQVIKYLSAKEKGAGVSAVDHGPGGNGGTRSQVGKPVQVQIVKNPGAVRAKRFIIERLKLLLASQVRCFAFTSVPFHSFAS